MNNRCAMRKLLYLAAALGSFAAAGCGGGASSVSLPSASGESVSGVVADGYLEKAEVFLDLNDDRQFTTGEPTATTDVDGKYTLTGVAAADLKNHAIVVLAKKGITINHEGSTGTTVAEAYILSTPPDAPKNPLGQVVITPLTTLIHNQIETNPILKIAEAEAAVKSNLGLAEATSLFEDFVPKQGASDEYLKVSRISQVVATAIGNNMAAIKTAAPAANLNDVIKVIVAEVVTQLTQIANTVATTSTADFNAAAIALEAVKVETTDSAALQQNLTQASAPVVISSFEKALGTDGFYWMDRNNDMQSSYYEYSVIKLGAQSVAGYALTEDHFIYTALNPTWVASTDKSSNYVLTKDGWILASDSAPAGKLVFNADGTATWTITATGQSEVISVSKIDLAQKAMGSFVARGDAPFKADAVFPAGAEGYRMTFFSKSDRYSIWAGDTGNSQLNAITSISQIPGAFAVGGTGSPLFIGYNFSVKFVAGAGASGTAQFYEGQLPLTAFSGTWKIIEPVAGYHVFVLDVPLAYKTKYMNDEPARAMILASVNGFIKQGSVEYANVARVDRSFNFNKIAFDAMMANFSPTWTVPVPVTNPGGTPTVKKAKKAARKL